MKANHVAVVDTGAGVTAVTFSSPDSMYKWCTRAETAGAVILNVLKVESSKEVMLALTEGVDLFAHLPKEGKK